MVDGKPGFGIRTGLTNRYTLFFRESGRSSTGKVLSRMNCRTILRTNIGLELVPSREPIEMLVVEKAQ